MPLFSKLKSLAWTLLRGSRLDRELDEELRGFVDELAARHRAAGMTPDAARRAALLEVGGVEQVKERVRDVRVGAWLETTWRDLRYGGRALLRSPGFALVVVLTLALGIGANVTIFSVMRAVLWKPLPYPEPDRLVVVEAETKGVTDTGLSPGELQDLRGESRTLEQIAAVNGVYASLEIDGDLERVTAISANDDLLPALGAMPPALGRPLRAELDDVAPSVRSVIIGDGLWRRRFGGDPRVIGRHILVNNLDVEVVGVLHPGFRLFAPGASYAAEEVDVWFPMALGTERASRHRAALGRLAQGVRIEQAQAELDTIASRLVAQHAGMYPDGTLRLFVHPLRDVLTQQARPALTALSAAVAFVLLIGCVNITNLMFARSGARQRELAVRQALGAGRARIVRQLFTENALLAGLGGVAGLLAAYGGVALLDWLRPTHLPRQSQVAVDGSVAAFTVLLSVIVCLVVGLLPVLRISRVREHEPLKAGRSETTMPGMRRLQRSLVIAEVALSIIPLVAGGLMVRTLWNLTQAPIGFDPSGLLTARIAFSLGQFRDTESRWAIQRDAIERVRQLPGVEAASAAAPLPFARAQFTRRVGREDVEAAGTVLANMQAIVPGYLQLTRTMLREGRDLDEDDHRHSRMVAIIDDRLARQLWPTGALGGKLAMRQGKRIDVFEIVGITNTVRTESVRDTEVATIMVPYHYVRNELHLVMRTSRSAADIGPDIRRAVESLGTRRPVTEIRPMRDYVVDSMGEARFTTLVLTGFAATSLLLAAIGLYGTLAYLTLQRTQEFGVRMALGASAVHVLHMVAREGIVLTAIGGVLGLAGAAAITGALRGLLYEVTPLDAPTLVGVTVLVATVAIAAAGQPAWRASRVDPAVALKGE